MSARVGNAFFRFVLPTKFRARMRYADGRVVTSMHDRWRDAMFAIESAAEEPADWSIEEVFASDRSAS